MESNVTRALQVAVACNVPTVLWGPPGSGKTSAITQLANGSGLPLEIVIAAIREPADFAGLPVVNRDDGSVRMAPPDWAQRLAESGEGILFLDEVSTAPPAVQSALLRVVLERTVGDLPLPPAIRVVAAANPPEQAADGWDLAAPLANRFCHLDWVVDANVWADGMIGGFKFPDAVVLSSEAIEQRVPHHGSRVASFIQTRADLLLSIPEDAASAGRAWPSPRSWTMAARLLAAAEVAGVNTTVELMLISGCVGPLAASMFVSWNVQVQLPDPEDLLANPTGGKFPTRGDLVYAVLASVAAAVTADVTAERWSAAWEVMARASDAGHADIAVAAIRPLVAIRPDGARPPASALKSLAGVLKTAGMFERLAAGA